MFLSYVLSLGLSYYKEGCKFRLSEEDRVLKFKFKIKRERHSSTSRTLRLFLVFLIVGSPDVRWEFQQLKVAAIN